MKKRIFILLTAALLSGCFSSKVEIIPGKKPNDPPPLDQNYYSINVKLPYEIDCTRFKIIAKDEDRRTIGDCYITDYQFTLYEKDFPDIRYIDVIPEKNLNKKEVPLDSQQIEISYFEKSAVDYYKEKIISKDNYSFKFFNSSDKSIGVYDLSFRNLSNEYIMEVPYSIIPKTSYISVFMDNIEVQRLTVIRYTSSNQVILKGIYNNILYNNFSDTIKGGE